MFRTPSSTFFFSSHFSFICLSHWFGFTFARQDPHLSIDTQCYSVTILFGYFCTFVAPTSARRPLYSTFSRLESSADLQVRPSEAFNSRQPGVGVGSRNFFTRNSQPSRAVNPYSGGNLLGASLYGIPSLGAFG